MTTFRPSPDGGLSYQRAGGAPGAMGCPPFLNASSSQPGEIHSARLAYRGSFTFVWSFTGNCIVIPMGCVAYPFCRSCCLTTSMTQYCHSRVAILGHRRGQAARTAEGICDASHGDDDAVPGE